MRTLAQIMDSVLDEAKGKQSWVIYLDSLAKTKEDILSILAFCKACKVKVNKPQISQKQIRMGINGRPSSFHFKDCFITPSTFLVLGDKKIRVAAKGIREIPPYAHIPDAFSNMESRNWLTLHQYNVKSEVYQPHMSEIVEAFRREAGDSWQACIDEVEAVWLDVETRLEEIWSAGSNKWSQKFHLNFQEKLSRHIHKTRSLLDVSPDMILSIIQPGVPVESLLEFRNRNYTNIDCVVLEDIVAAQKEAYAQIVVEEIMES